MAPFKLSDWNATIQRVNALSCVGTPLPQVTAPHRWGVADIQTVRNKLAAICGNSPTFSVTLDKWKQSIVDELNNAIANCQCCDPTADFGVTLRVPLTGTQTVHGSGLYSFITFQWDLSQLNGLQAGHPGVAGRVLTLAVSIVNSDPLYGTSTQSYSLTSYLACTGLVATSNTLSARLGGPNSAGTASVLGSNNMSPGGSSTATATLTIPNMPWYGCQCQADCTQAVVLASIAATPAQLANAQVFFGSTVNSAGQPAKLFQTLASLNAAISAYNQGLPHASQLYIQSQGYTTDPLNIATGVGTATAWQTALLKFYGS